MSVTQQIQGLAESNQLMRDARSGKLNLFGRSAVMHKQVPAVQHYQPQGERMQPQVRLADTRFQQSPRHPWPQPSAASVLEYGEPLDQQYAAKQLYPLVQAEMPIAAQRQFISLSNKPGQAYTTAPSVLPGVPLSYVEPRCTGGPRVVWKQALQVLPFVEGAEYDPFRASRDGFCTSAPWLGRDYASGWVYPSRLPPSYVSPASPEAMPLFLNSDKSFLTPSDGSVVSQTYLKGNLCASPNCVPFCDA